MNMSEDGGRGHLISIHVFGGEDEAIRGCASSGAKGCRTVRVYDQFGSERFRRCLLRTSPQPLRFLFFMQVITSPSSSRRGLKVDTGMEYQLLRGVRNVTRTCSFRNKLEELWPPNMVHCCEPLPGCTDVIA
jgi:hypothetical protein